MGCPYDASFVFGIQVTEEQKDKLQKRMDEMDKDGSFKDDDFVEVMCAGNGRDDYYYVDLAYSYGNRVSTCDVIGVLRDVEKMKERAIETFNKSSLMREFFKESDIKALLICNYTG